MPREDPKPSAEQQGRDSLALTEQAIKLSLPPQRLYHSLINTCETKQNCSCMFVTNGAQRDLSMWGKFLQGARKGNCCGGKADTRVPGMRRSQRPLLGTQHSNKYLQGTMKCQKKKKSIPFCNVIKRAFFFFSDKANLLCFVHGRRAINDQQYSPELPSSVHSNSIYTTLPLNIQLHTHTIQNPVSFLENPFHKSLHKNNSSESDTF